MLVVCKTILKPTLAPTAPIRRWDYPDVKFCIRKLCRPVKDLGESVQARIKELIHALFTHCFTHNLNSALVNAACDNAHVQNFFGIVELHTADELLVDSTSYMMQIY